MLEEELIVGRDIETSINETADSPTSFSIELEKGVDYVNYPLSTIYPLDSIYPMPNAIFTSINYPLDNIYPMSDSYPTRSDYKYVIFKYKTSEGTYYTVSFYTEKKGVFTVKTYYERSE